MEVFYPQIKDAHVAAVIASGVLFATRGVAIQCGAVWPMAPPVRWVSYGIDSVLLAAAIVLASILQQFPFVNSWLTAKLCLLIVYIGLGAVALRCKARPRVRMACYVVALLVYAYIASIAVEHDPRGMLLMLER